jgi:hypothetical protein
MNQQGSSQTNGPSITVLASAGVFTGFMALAAIELFANTGRVDATFDPVFCSPTALHTTIEPPETQLTRDNAAIRTLLKDAGDHFTQIRKIYAGEIHVVASSGAQPASLQRGSRGGLFKPDYQRTPWNGSLRQEAQRLDRERGTALAVSIDDGIAAGDRARIEAALRATFAGLLDDLLLSIEQKLATSANVERTLQHARRYYSEGLDAYLSINAAPQAGRASYALDAMVKAAEDVRAGKLPAKDWFAHERANFMQAVNEGLGARSGRQATL